MDNNDDDIETAVSVIRDANAVMVFTGAGMSVESGISTFRGKDGLWKGLLGKLVMLYGGAPIGWKLTPSLTWRYFISDLYKPSIEQAQPHKGHAAITKLQEWFCQRQRDDNAFPVVTMNVDGLHQMAGTQNVYEVHGTALKFVCGKCGRRMNPPFANGTYQNKQWGKGWIQRGTNGTTITAEEMDDDKDDNVPKNREACAFDFWDKVVPRCREFHVEANCSGRARPDVTLFGEGLPYETFQNVESFVSRYMTQRSVCIVIGTSSVVYPAAGIPEQCAAQGSTIIEINPVLPTPLTNLANIQIPMSAGDAMEAIVNRLTDESG